MEPLINYFKDIKIRNILDVGTGSGGFIHTLQKSFPDAGITGIDPDAKFLETAKKDFPDLLFMEMEAENLMFNDDTFDVVSISMALHHLPKIKKGLKEMKRVLKPNGYFIINETISDNLTPAQEVHKMYHHFRSQTDRISGKYHRKTFTKDAILHMLKIAGLQVQFIFEHRSNLNLAKTDSELEQKVEKMQQMLEKTQGRSEYEVLFPQIEEFRSKAKKYGFQPATNLVLVVRKKIID